jgi:predicted nucleic acid-binding protein
VQSADLQLHDEADRLVPGTFLATNARYLVTGGKDLLNLAHRYRIISPANFWQLHGE